MPKKENVYKKRGADERREKPSDFKNKGERKKRVNGSGNDELSAPRFLPKKNFTGKDDKRPFSRSNFAGGKPKPGDRDKKPSYGGKPVKRFYDENDKNELSSLAFKNKRKDEAGDNRLPKSGDAKYTKRDKFEPRKENDRPERRGNKREGGDERKPFRPKYDPEIKLGKGADKARKTRNERISELTGVKDEKTDIRLNKYIANSGVCSRREADELIKKGLVTVNGKVVTEMGHKVKKEDEVRFEGRKILPEPFVYILMNKPKDFITTTDDDLGRKTVMDLLADKVEQRVYPIGRLDRNTTGVLLLTNDGEVTQVLAHPSFNIKKVYHAVLDKKVSGSDLDKLVEGVELEDGVVFADAVTYVDNEDKSHVGVEIHSGKNRVVRRMFESLGYEVEKLDRVSFGIFTKKDLPRGKWRHLTQSEVGFLLKLKKQLQ